jgi:hypothetical protein
VPGFSLLPVIVLIFGVTMSCQRLWQGGHKYEVGHLSDSMPKRCDGAQWCNSPPSVLQTSHWWRGCVGSISIGSIPLAAIAFFEMK